MNLNNFAIRVSTKNGMVYQTTIQSVYTSFNKAIEDNMSDRWFKSSDLMVNVDDILSFEYIGGSFIK